MTIVLDVAADVAAMAENAAEYVCAALSAQVESLSVCLSGGESPRPVYEALTREPFRTRMPWGRIHWFFGDERCVPPTDPRSNFRMVHEALFAHVEVPAANIHAVPTEGLTPKAAAAAYERALKDHYGADALADDRALFDLTFLGLGEDGHTASLFPGSAALTERARWAVDVATPSQPEPRVTLTYPVLEASRAVVFLVAGEKKRAILARLLAGDDSLPAANLHAAGPMHAFVDVAAAGKSAA